MITAVDTNVFLDILVPRQGALAEASQRALENAWSSGSLIIGEVVYAELATHFGDRRTLDTFLKDGGVNLQSSPRDALTLAAVAFHRYLSVRGHGITCPRCGTVNNLDCSSCGQPIQVRQHIVSDFLVGAHAQVCADALLTRDLGIYRTYFPKLMVVAP